MSQALTTTSSRLPPAPSRRNLEIYKRAIVLRHEQLAIAMDYNLSQPRINQIVAQVRRWLATRGNMLDPAIRDHHAHQQLSKATQKMRLLAIIDRATYAMENRLPSDVTTKTRYHGTTEFWREETRKLSPQINFPAMRLLLRTVQALDGLDSHTQDDVPERKSSPLSEEDLLQSVFEFLCRWRTRAEASGQLPPSADIHQFIADGLANLIGAPLDTSGRVLNLPSVVEQASCLPNNTEQPSSQLPIPDSLLPPLPPPALPTDTPPYTPLNISPPSSSPIVATPDQPSPSANQ